MVRGRGVTVNERWHDFWNFVYEIDNVIENGKLLYLNDYQLDKDLKSGNEYSVEKCTVISAEEHRRLHQLKQMKKVKAYNMEETLIFYSLAETNERLNISRSSIISCIKRGNCHEKTGYHFEYVS